jgi:hypothetical protein
MSTTTVFGCPFQSLDSLQSATSACPITKLRCATATPVNLNAACCGSLTNAVGSVLSCFQSQSLTCLDTSSVMNFLTGAGGNRCAAYETTTGSSSSSTIIVRATNSTHTGTNAPTSKVPGGSGGSPTSSISPGPIPTLNPSEAPRVGPGLKVYIGVVLVGALAVLSIK